MMRSIRHYLELIRFSHTIFALPFAILAATWASALVWEERSTSYIGRSWLGVLLCMVFARSFAMAWNRLADAKLDGENPRTKTRHIPAGILTSHSVRAFALVCAIGFFISCSLFLPNWLPVFFATPVLIWLAGYSYAKRFTSLAHFWLGIALMLAPICVWIALRGEFVTRNVADLLPAVLLGSSVLFWVAGFDIIYACQDESFDKQSGLHSVPALLGTRGALRLASWLHLLVPIPLVATAWLCPQLSLGILWYVAIVVVAGLLAYEHFVVSHKDLSRINLAFFQLNAAISLILLAAGVVDSTLLL